MNLIVAVDNRWGIGKNNNLLFRLPKDMAFFRQTTTGKVVVMGANTFLSLPNGALPNRTTIVLDNSGATHSGTTTVSSVEELFQELANYNTDDVYVCGGSMVYKLLLPFCAKALITKVQADGQAQVFAPNLDEDSNWQLVESSEQIEDGQYKIVFCTYVNKQIRH